MVSDTALRSCMGVVVALGLTVAWPGALAAQHGEAPRPAAYALTNVTLVQADGGRREGVTVVVRGKYIQAIGEGVEPPADAEVLDGDSLVVYPGIVDAQGAAEAELPEPAVEWDTIARWAPPRTVQGYMPSRRLVDHLTATGESLDEQRKAGVVAAAVHPGGSMMPGRGALLLFRNGAERPAELVLTPVLGPTFTFEDSRAYPSTLFGVIAFMRQRFADATRRAEVEARFANSSGRLARPVWDADLAVLRDVMDGDPRVFFHADVADDIRRAVGLADAHGFQPVIVGGRHAWEAAELLADRRIPVLVSLDFPAPERWDPEAEEASPEAGEAAGEAPQAGGAGVGEPLDAAALDEKQRLEEMYANAGRLEAAGVTFALTSGGGEADILEGARKAIEYGLSEEAALRAITATPASLLGVPRLARVEAGAPATFIVTDGPLFDEETRVAYTVVEGWVEMGAEEGAGGDEPPAVDVTGTWTLESTTQGESTSGTLELTQDGASFEGTWTTMEGEARVVDGVVSGSEISFTLVIDAGQQTVRARLTGVVEGDEASGDGTVSFGDQSISLTWTARRTSAPPDRGGTR